MKKLGLLAVVAMLAVSCNNKAGGNKGVVKLERDSYTLEDVHHGAKGHETEHAEEVKADSTAVKTEVANDSIKTDK